MFKQIKFVFWKIIIIILNKKNVGLKADMENNICVLTQKFLERGFSYKMCDENSTVTYRDR